MCRALFVVITVSLFFCKFACAGSLVLSGSSTVLPIMEEITKIYLETHADTEISFVGGGSNKGIRVLLEGISDIAMASDEIEELDREEARFRGFEIYGIPIALDALVPIVHPENTVNDLTVEQLRAIYSGKITNWKELGGEDARLVIASRDIWSGSYEAWMQYIMGDLHIVSTNRLRASNQAIVQIVAENKNAIGYIGFAYLDDSLQAIKISGVEANLQNIQNKSWPLVRVLWLYTKTKPKEEVQKLIDFILAPEGQAIIKKVGSIPYTISASEK